MSLQKQHSDIPCSSLSATGNQVQSTIDDLAGSELVKKCLLCGDRERQKSRYETWGELERAYLEKHLGYSPANNSYTCKKHLLEATRHGHDKEHIPSWKECTPNSTKQQKCFNPKCENESPEKLIKPMFTSNDKLMEIFKIKITAETNQPFVLCRKCYNDTYGIIYGSRIPCSSCGATPKSSTAFDRHSPDAEKVSQHLSDSTGQQVQISPSDYICYACYKMHCSILDSLRSPQGSDNMLQQSIEKWVNKHKHNESTDKLTKAVLKTVIYVANQLLVEKAVLLPWACQVFLDAYDIQHTGSIKSAKVTIETGDSSIMFKSEWLLHQLITYLNCYMSYKCVHMRFGTILYRKGIDIMVSLSWALSAIPFPNHTCEPYTTTTKQTSNKSTKLHEASYIINDLIQEEIKKQSAARKNPISLLNLDTQLQHTNPLLLDFLNSITATVRERKHSTLQKESDISKHSKKVRIYYIICLLQFCTNPSQPTLIHDMLADAVEMCGGSRQLLRILNRLGCTSSPDTHDRFVTQHAELQRKHSIWDEIPPSVFTVASVDNFDMLQSYAAVYCGNQQRSYHGTTVQLVQPSHKITIRNDSETAVSVQTTITSQLENPTIVMHEADSETSTLTSPLPQHHAITKRAFQCSPDRSPHKAGKVGPKRKRTVTAKNLTSELQRTTTSTTHMYAESLTMADFEESNDEEKEHQILSSKIFTYIMLKYTNHYHIDYTNYVLSDMRQFFDNEDDEKVQPSKVYYMELINENPDSDDTMCLVAEDLLEKFKQHNGWVVLVGDGKTYQHLQNIKRQYGKAFENLIVFPGDWHTLKNYQPILIKVYYHAGLKELAESCGFRSTTLKSLESCSNFKRTHCFLVQVWEAIYREMVQMYVYHTNPTDLMENVKCFLEAGIKESQSPYNLMVRLDTLMQEIDSLANFMKFVHKMAEIDDVWKLWVDFVFTNCYCYLTLYLAIRGSNWKLRLSSLKRMAPLFAAFDRDTYEKIIPQHLADLKQYPACVTECLEAGGFTVSITGKRWHSVAFDEAHEMCINKDLKAAVTHPSQEYLQKTSLFFNCRIKAFKNLMQELFPEKFKEFTHPNTITDGTPHAKHCEENILKMCALITSNKLINVQEENRGLVNMFSGQVATPEQSTDMLSFRSTGLEAFKQYVNTRILNTPSCVSAPVRHRRLLTMATTRKTRTRLTPKEQESKQVIKCLRRRLQWCNQNQLPYDSSEEQYSVLPRALANEDGYPHKGTKSHWTDKLQQRYQLTEPRVFMNQVPWVPQTVIIDAMFMINTRPLRRTTTIAGSGHVGFIRCGNSQSTLTCTLLSRFQNIVGGLRMIRGMNLIGKTRRSRRRSEAQFNF